jgi:hypothetical protein
MTAANEAYDVFISYARADGRHAAEIDSFLRAHGLRPFFDRRSFLPRLSGATGPCHKFAAKFPASDEQLGQIRIEYIVFWTPMAGRGRLIAAILTLPACVVTVALYAQTPGNTADEPPAAGTAAVTGAPDAATTPAPARKPGPTEYQHKLAAYTLARQKFDSEAAVYWSAVAEKRRLRRSKRRDGMAVGLDDYVLTQPPRYTGPPPPAGQAPQGPPRKYIPVVADFLKSAQEHFGFAPQRPKSEMEFKRAYARLALDAGLTREQIVRVYVFETGGNGAYDSQAGLEYSSKARAVSPALGYNQLLNTNSVELLAEQGDAFAARLKARATALDGEAKRTLERKIEVVRKMIALSRTVPDEWKAHDDLANTPEGLGVHALLLDIDVGPMLQVQKLMDSVTFARSKGRETPLTAAELEMMNLTGDGNGLDIILMPAAVRERVPTANFFLQAGYERNPVAIRNNVVAKLLAVTDAAMDRGMNLPGARELAAAGEASLQTDDGPLRDARRRTRNP